MFDTVLIANRGEIAVRVIGTLRRMGIRSVAVYSDADAHARHVREADVAVHIGPAAAAESYLSIEKIIEAARKTGAQAIHPGYGFLSENAAFAAACEKAGIVFIGPPASAIESMGDKIRAKRMVAAAGVPVVPGRIETGMTDAQLAEAADEVGYPVLLKPSAGGGGKGMREVNGPDELADAIASARREASASFGDDTLLLERLIRAPRHIEIQVLADGMGNVISLGERECSLQRRHQKIVEEAPSPLLTLHPDGDSIRARMGQAAVDAAKAVGYVGVGTVEYIVSGDAPDDFFFMEMNTRLQVEHPVTELVTGIDLVEQQLRVAAGQSLAISQDQVALTGHAIEVRLYAEDPSRGFLPTGGRVLALREPATLRVDSALFEGAVVSSDYDPMLAKYIAHGDDRDTALRKLSSGLRAVTVLGVTTNIAFLQRLLADDDVRAGKLDTGLIGRKLDSLTSADVPDHVLLAAALDRALALEPAGDDPWEVPGGWRIGDPAPVRAFLTPPGQPHVEVAVTGRAADAQVRIGDNLLRAAARLEDGELVVDHDGTTRRYARARDGAVLWLAADGVSWALTLTDRLSAARADAAAATGGPITSPMPGTVLDVRVKAGEKVSAGQALLVVEAMKMEHTITAQIDGIVAELPVRAGQQVALDERLALITPEESP
ncbi:MAG TPA: acetyl/propionyl/methylcrotonyl-CoA carboxylase subunit alpha [Pseudonocardiaceae bacterium]|nr:acetyl/propionyl/methylcrotonyl-CoA carboxylase subunit alpha [Pseudonocardiaceae bacterium]